LHGFASFWFENRPNGLFFQWIHSILFGDCKALKKGLENDTTYFFKIQFVVGLGLVIFAHELGHFIAAKAVDIRVEQFALGFGTRLFGFKRGEADYRINLLPLGGYVKMAGQEDFAPLKMEDRPDSRAFPNKSVGQRFAVISAAVMK
jgi:RIP metalloprotease RseP